MLLTDLIKPEHLERLGDVEWDDGLHFRKRLVRLRANSYYRDIWIPSPAQWAPDGQLSCHEASCILEHAIRVKLLDNCLFVFPVTRKLFAVESVLSKKHDDTAYYEVEPEALIAAIDSLIEGER